MAIDPTDFDPYHKWLGIPKNRRPPTHYDLLGVSLDEDDREVIRSAAQQRKTFVESQRGKGHDSAVAGVLYQLGEAEITLISPELRRDYDRRLHLFHRRRRNRQIDPNVGPSQFQSRPGRAVGEESGLFKTFAGIMLVLVGGFGLMAALSFYLPWSRLTSEPKETSQPGPALTVQSDNAAMDGSSEDAPAPTIPVQPTEPEKAATTDGWIPLFNGHSLGGWSLYGGGAPGNGWNAVDGTLVLKGGSGKDIMTAWQFEDFELEFEWMSDGKSGLCYRVRTGDPFIHLNAPEYQIEREESGALSNLFTVSNPVRPNGEFNQGRIVARGNSLEHWINGTKVVDATIGDSAWKEGTSQTRFLGRPNFASTRRGYIGLRDRGDDITFRNIRIRPLTNEPTPPPAGGMPESTVTAAPPVSIPVGKLQMELKGHAATVTYLAVSPDGQSIASASDDQTVRLWDRNTGKELWRSPQMNSGFHAMRFTPKGDHLFVATREKGISFDVRTGKPKIHISFPNSHAALATGVVDFNKSCDRLVVTERGAVSVYDIETRKRITNYPQVWISYVKFHETNGECFAADDGAPGKDIVLVKYASKNTIRRFPGLRDRTIAMQTSRDGKYLAAAVGPGDPKDGPTLSKVFVWEIDTEKLIREFHTPQSWQYGLAFSPDGRMLVSGGGGWEQDWYGHGPVGDKTIHLWDIESGKELRRFVGHDGAIRAIAFHPDGKSFVSAGFDGIVRVWDVSGDSP